MHELVILSFDTPSDAERARAVLQQTASADVVVLPSSEALADRSGQWPGRRPSDLRGWVLLPWRIGAKALGGALTVVTWGSLLVSATAGEFAGRLLDVDRGDRLHQQITQVVQTGKTPVIMLTRGQASGRLIETFAQAPDQIYKTRISPEAAARIRSAFRAD